MKKNKWFEKDNLLFILFYFILAVMMLVAVVAWYKVQFNGVNDKQLILCILLDLIIVTFIIILGKRLESENVIFERLLIILIIATSIIIRIFSFTILKTVPVSDFKVPTDFYNYFNQRGPYISGEDADFYQLYYARFPAWFTYMRIVRLIYNIFGFNVNYIVYMNILLNAGTTLVIYLVGKKIFSKKTGFLAAGLYAFSPSMIVYSSVHTPDHFSMLLIGVICMFWSRMYNARKFDNKKGFYTNALLVIFFACLLNLFKPLKILLLLVFVCTEIMCSYHEVFANLKVYLKKNYRYWLMFITTFIVSSWLTSSILNMRVESVVKIETVDSLPMYLFTGYSVNDSGHYDNAAGDEILYQLMEKYGQDQEGLMKELSILARQQLKDNSKHLINIWAEKYGSLVSNEYTYWSFANYSDDVNYTNSLETAIGPVFLRLAASSMLIIYIGVIILAAKQIFTSSHNDMLVTLSLMIVGYLLMLIVGGGVQSRYKSIIMPIMILVSAQGWEIFANLFRNIVDLSAEKIKKRRNN